MQRSTGGTVGQADNTPSDGPLKNRSDATMDLFLGTNHELAIRRNASDAEVSAAIRDIIFRGLRGELTLTGGGSRLAEFDEWLANETGMRVITESNPNDRLWD